MLLVSFKDSPDSVDCDRSQTLSPIAPPGRVFKNIVPDDVNDII